MQQLVQGQMIRRGRGRPPKDFMNMTGIQPQPRPLSWYQQNKAKVETKEEEVPSSFTCQLCSKTYDSAPALYLHIKMKHPETAKAQDQAKTENPDDDMLNKRRGRPRVTETGQYVHQGLRMDPIGT
jgi:hypothetical protein